MLGISLENQPIPEEYLDHSSSTPADSKPRIRFRSQKSTEEVEESKDTNQIADTLLQVD